MGGVAPPAGRPAFLWAPSISLHGGVSFSSCSLKQAQASCRVGASGQKWARSALQASAVRRIRRAALVANCSWHTLLRSDSCDLRHRIARGACLIGSIPLHSLL